ncbi:hypothetical protein [Hyphomonas oceanitis]|uniref:Uncharacterized protein n=1 Tax=Hyphomonas oceanitis SCH89 TaxID=1280953 RepID=A0A059GC43_9PROT|nr:hypothetical protein [Hyphomonas oceanitis]KDA04063.1 hypothetical protein HOC_01956 [Hyphomonas oceanitis SCH89]
MSERNGSEQPKHRGLIVSIFLAGVICLAVWLVYSHIHRTERNNAASEYENKGFIECVSTSALIDAPTCLTKAFTPPYEQSTDYYDLKAQQDMAKWALLMLVVTAVGVVYIAITLKEAASATLAAQDAVRVTRQIGEAQTVAYPVSNRMTIELFRENGKHCGVLIISHWTNAGNTPTLDFGATHRLKIKVGDEVKLNEPLPTNVEEGLKTIDPHNLATLHSELKDSRLADYEEAMKDGTISISVEAIVTYRTVFKKVETVTAHYRSVEPRYDARATDVSPFSTRMARYDPDQD